MNCIILGAGYVGSKAAEAVKNAGGQVALFSRTSKPGYLMWPGKFPEQFDTLLFSVAPDKGADYTGTYLENAYKLIDSPLKRIIYTSSTSVYGEHEGKEVTEDTPLHALNARTKILIETEEALLRSNKEVVIFRLGEIIGPGREVKDRLTPGQVFPGTGQNIVNQIHLNDITRAIMFALQNPLKGVYNLVNDFHPTRKELYDSIRPGISWDPKMTSQHGGNKTVSNQKLKACGFNFQH